MRLARSKILPVMALLGAVLAALRCAAASGGESGSDGRDGPSPVLVEVLRPERGTLVRRIDLVASLEPWEQATLYAKASGYLKSISVDRGDRVRAGDVLAVLDIPEMEDEVRQLEARRTQAEAEVRNAEADVRLQELTVGRLQAIRAEEPGATTQQELDLATGRLEAAQASLAAAQARLGVVRADLARLTTLLGYARITAPYDGIITERFVDPGALVTAGTQSKPTPIVRIVNASRLRAMVDVPETEVAHLEEGKAARLRLDAHPGRIFEGAVSRFSRALDPKTRTMRTEVLIVNKEGILAPGMFGSISLDLERREDVLTLSPTSVHFQKDQTYVFVAENGRVRRVKVICGADDGNAVEIVSGLTGTEAIIARASAPLADGTPIAVAASKNAADKNAAERSP